MRGPGVPRFHFDLRVTMPTRRPRSYTDADLRRAVNARRAVSIEARRSYRERQRMFRNLQIGTVYNPGNARMSVAARLNLVQPNRNQRLVDARNYRNRAIHEYYRLADELRRREQFVDTTARARQGALMLAYKR